MIRLKTNHTIIPSVHANFLVSFDFMGPLAENGPSGCMIEMIKQTKIIRTKIIKQTKECE